MQKVLKHKRYSLTLLVFLMISCTDPVLKKPFVITRSPEDIRPVTGKWIRPVFYHNQINFDTLPVELKKKKFIQMLLPSILMVKRQIEVERRRVGDIIQSMDQKKVLAEEDSLFLHTRINQLKAVNAHDLYNRLATHPNSIVLAQAAIESGWGSSRFFKEANNVFGIWSYNSNENRIAATESRGEQAIYLRSYPDLTQAIADYFLTLARARPYATFRKQRLKVSDPYKLTAYLKSYSELGSRYVDMLNALIRENQLTQYDSVKLDPSYYNDLNEDLR